MFAFLISNGVSRVQSRNYWTFYDSTFQAISSKCAARHRPQDIRRLRPNRFAKYHDWLEVKSSTRTAAKRSLPQHVATFKSTFLLIGDGVRRVRKEGSRKPMFIFSFTLETVRMVHTIVLNRWGDVLSHRSSFRDIGSGKENRDCTRMYEKMTWKTDGDFEGVESLVKKFVGGHKRFRNKELAQFKM